MRARKTTAEAYGPLLIGVDPARFGDDRTSIWFRQGRRNFNVKSYVKKDTMEVTGIINTLIQEHNPAKVFVDIGGLGAGIIDRCKELGLSHIVVGVNAGSSPLNSNKYFNKRAEMWGLALEYLQDEPVELPDMDSVHADLCAPRYSFDSKSRLVIEKKEDMKKRGLRSPDEADAFCLTFAYPESAFQEKPANKILDRMSRNFENRLNAINKTRS